MLRAMLHSEYQPSEPLSILCSKLDCCSFRPKNYLAFHQLAVLVSILQNLVSHEPELIATITSLIYAPGEDENQCNNFSGRGVRAQKKKWCSGTTVPEKEKSKQLVIISSAKTLKAAMDD